MSSYIKKQHLKVILGQESRVGKAWLDYYGPRILSRGMMVLPFAFEQFYSYTGASEWELAVICMIINCSELKDGPVAYFELQDFTSRFHLSQSQIRRKLNTMVKKELLTITPVYAEKGHKVVTRLYDCNLFLDKIFTCICSDDDWHLQQNEILDSIGIDEPFDDLDMLSSYGEDDYLVPAKDHLSHPSDIPTSTEWTSMHLSSENSIDASMPSSSVNGIDASMPSSSANGIDASMHPSSENSIDASPTSYARAHTHIHAPDSKSKSKSNINTCINILETDLASNSCVNNLKTDAHANSNSNSNLDESDLSDLFADEDFNVWLHTVRPPVEVPYLTEARLPFDETLFVQTSDEADDPSRFERRLLDTIGVARPPYDDPYREIDEDPSYIDPALDAKITKAIKQQYAALRQEYEASKLYKQADKQLEAAPLVSEAVDEGQVQQQEQMQQQALETEVSASPIPAATSPDREIPVLLPGHSRTAIYHISNNLHDAHPHSSRAQARTLYSQLLTINQIEDEYSMSNPDLYFSDLMRTVEYAIRNKTFRSRNHDGHPNGMPLFFYELKKRVADQVATVAELRREGNYQSMYHERRKIASALNTIAGPTDSSQEAVCDFMRQQKAAKETAQLALTNAQIVEHARRLQLPMTDAEADSMLDNSAPELLVEQLSTAVRLGLYYEIIDK